MKEQLFGERRFPLYGLLASGIGIIFILAPMIPYEGTAGEPFSIFNHYVSELGEVGVSVWAPVFNIGMMLAGLLFIPFFIGLGLYLDNVLAKIGAIGGVYSAISSLLAV